MCSFFAQKTYGTDRWMGVGCWSNNHSASWFFKGKIKSAHNGETERKKKEKGGQVKGVNCLF